MSQDHAAEARKHIDWIHGWQETEGSTDATHLAMGFIAQAEATLAVAHEQRTANLLALTHHPTTDLTDASDEVRAEWLRIMRLARTALGLDGGDQS